MVRYDLSFAKQTFIYRGEITVVVYFCKLKDRMNNLLKMNDKVIAGNFIDMIIFY